MRQLDAIAHVIKPKSRIKKIPTMHYGMGTDSVDAKLTPKEAVLNRNASELFGRHNIRTMNDIGNMLAACGVDLPSMQKKRGYQMGSEDIEPGILPGNIPANEGQQWAPKGNSNQVQIFGGRLGRPDFSGYRGDLNPIDNRSYNGMLNNLFGGFGRAPWMGAPGWNNFTAFNPPGGFQGAGQGPTNIPSYFNAQGYPMAQLAGSPDAILQKQHFGFKKNK